MPSEAWSQTQIAHIHPKTQGVLLLSHEFQRKITCERKSNVWLSITSLWMYGMNHELFISYPGPGPAQPTLRTVSSGQVTELVQRTPTRLTLGSSLCTQAPTPLSYMLIKPSP